MSATITPSVTQGRPLAGITILDLSMFVAGPFATAVLSDLGAQVLKIEPPGGDPVRSNQTGPLIGGMSAQFHTFNHGKSSLVLDLKQPAGVEVFEALVPKTDVVFNNFRPGVMTRLGIDHESLRNLHPALVSVSLSAFGSEGPWTKRPAYDLVVQALGGGMSLTGHPQTGPAHIPFHLGDTAGGLYAAIAILAAVLEARATGHGRAYEVAMLDAQLALLSDEVTNHFTGQWPGEPHGAGHPAFAPYSAYPTQDHPLVIAAVGTEQFWLNLLAALGLQSLRDDPRFATSPERSRHRGALDDILSSVLKQRTRSEWLEVLEDADVPAAPILSLADAVRTPHVIARDLITSLPAGENEVAKVPVVPIREEGAKPFQPVDGVADLGASHPTILREMLGLSTHEIEQLRARGAFG